MKYIILLSLFFLVEVTFAQKKDENVIYKYKKHESFDLGSLEIKGNVIAPGDLTIKRRGGRRFSRKLLDRFDFDKEVEEDIKNLR